jgi:hypothetical protein
MVWKRVDGSVVSGDPTEDGGYSVAPGALFTTERSAEYFHKSRSGAVNGRSWRSNGGGREVPGSPESDKARARTSLGGDLDGLRGTLLSERDPSYVQAAPLSFFTQVAHGSSASHFWG